MKSLFLTFALLATISLFADTEPNDVLADASDLPFATPLAGSLDVTDNVDWYKIEAPTAGDLEVVIAPPFTPPPGSFEIQCFFRSSTGGSLGSPFFSSNDTVKFVFNCSGELTYYLEVRRTIGSGSYEISYNVPDLTFPEDNEPNNNIASAQEIFDGVQVSGYLGHPRTATSFDNNDYFKLEMPTSGSVTAKMNITDGLVAGLTILKSTGGVLKASFTSLTGFSTLTLDCVAEETLYFRMKKSVSCGSYSLEVEVDPAPLSNDLEPNNTIAQALDLFPGVPAEGHLGHVIDPPLDSRDYYKFFGSGEITLTAVYEDVFKGKISLLDASSSVLASTPISTDTFSLISYTLPSAGTYYALVQPMDCGAYTLLLENNCTPPANLSADPIISIGAFLNWDLVPDATDYLLEKRIVGAADWDAPVSVSTTSYPWYPIASCVDHEFRVASICGSDTSLFSDPLTFQTLCAPVCDVPAGVSVSSVSMEAATISWTAALVDLGYRVQYVDASTLTPIFTEFTTNSALTISSLDASKNYLFRVNAYCLDNGVSGFATGSFTTSSPRMDGMIAADISIYPNPVRDLLHLQIESKESIDRIELYNSSGQQVLVEQAASSEPVTLDCSQLPAGLYQLSVFDLNQMRVYQETIAIQ